MDEEESEFEGTKEEKRAALKYTLKTYLGFLKNYKFLIGIILFLVLLMEVRHIVESYLFKILVDKGTLFAAGEILKSEFVNILMIILGVFSVAVITGFAGRWIQQHLVNVLESKLVVDLKKKYFNHLLDLDFGFHVSHKTGSIISRLTRAGGAMESLTDDMAYTIAPMIFSFIVVMISFLYFDYVSAIVTGIVIIIFISYSYFMQKIAQESHVLANDAEDIEKSNVSDIFTNMESIKYYGKENFVKRKFEDIINFTRKASMKNLGYYRWLDSVHSITIGIGTIFLLLFPIIRFINGSIDLGTIVFIYSVYAGLIEPLYGFVYGLRGVYSSMADFQALFEYGKIEKKINDIPNAKKLEIANGEIEFKNVNFSYGRRKILEDFNLKIPADSKVAFVGQSGSGKTTLIKLLYRFYDIDSGQILIDGEDIKNFRQESLRSEMSIVPQECILFDDSIYNNILFSKPNASKEEVMNAIKFAQLDKVIERFPNKENTIVGERGVKLSGGEKQRVSIARAILANKKILVLDEATSSLDSETEFEIQKDLAKLMKGRTSIIIAHRLSTIMGADKIVVLNKGKIIQEGKHSRLISEAGDYKRLWNLQKEGYLVDKYQENLT